MVQVKEDITGNRYGKLIVVRQDAIITRLKAEVEYFKDFAPNKDLYKKYKIVGD